MTSPSDEKPLSPSVNEWRAMSEAQRKEYERKRREWASAHLRRLPDDDIPLLPGSSGSAPTCSARQGARDSR